MLKIQSGLLLCKQLYLQLVIEPEFDIRHATQEHLHDNLAIDITPQHSALVAHEHVDLHKAVHCQGDSSCLGLQASSLGLHCVLVVLQQLQVYMWVLTKYVKHCSSQSRSDSFDAMAAWCARLLVQSFGDSSK